MEPFSSKSNLNQGEDTAQGGKEETTKAGMRTDTADLFWS